MSLTPASSQRILFHPSRSSRHRVACLALYRALVRQALLVPLEPPPSASGPPAHAPPRTILHHLIRRQFDRNSSDVSKRLVFSALAAGYKFLALLGRAKDAASPEHRSVTALVAQRRKEAEISRLNNPRQNPRRPAGAPGAPGAPVDPFDGVDPSDTSSPDPITRIEAPAPQNPVIKLVKPATLRSPPVYARAQPMRPTNELKSRRHIPVLVVTGHGYPFLRFGKPQTPWLSPIIHHCAVRREGWASATTSLNEEFAEMAENEDLWDILAAYMRKRYLGEHAEADEKDIPAEQRWTYMDAVNVSVKQVGEDWSMNTLDLAAQAKALQEIVEEERRARDREDEMGWFYPPKEGDGQSDFLDQG